MFFELDASCTLILARTLYRPQVCLPPFLTLMDHSRFLTQNSPVLVCNSPFSKVFLTLKAEQTPIIGVLCAMDDSQSRPFPVALFQVYRFRRYVDIPFSHSLSYMLAFSLTFFLNPLVTLPFPLPLFFRSQTNPPESFATGMRAPHLADLLATPLRSLPWPFCSFCAAVIW